MVMAVVARLDSSRCSEGATGEGAAAAWKVAPAASWQCAETPGARVAAEISAVSPPGRPGSGEAQLSTPPPGPGARGRASGAPESPEAAAHAGCGAATAELGGVMRNITLPWAHCG